MELFSITITLNLTSQCLCRKLLNFEWDVLFYLLYSSDLAPSGYYLFLSLKYFLRDKKFDSLKVLKSHFDQFFGSKRNLHFEIKISCSFLKDRSISLNKTVHIYFNKVPLCIKYYALNLYRKFETNFLNNLIIENKI